MFSTLSFVSVVVCLLALGVLTSYGRGVYHCEHQSPTVHQLSYAAVANTASGPHRGKRQTGSEFRPIRIVPFYDSTVENLTAEIKQQIKTEAVQYVADYFKKILNVRPISGKLLFQRDCVNGSKVFLNPQGYCSRTQGCTPHASCSGLATLPDEHLAACRVCDDDGTNCETIGQNGTGVENADFVLYVSANVSHPKCSPSDATLAFAVACQLERQYDRPIVGFANICPNKALDNGVENLRTILFHEVTHAMLFSPVLFAFYRDANGNPRTARDPTTGLPMHLGTNSVFVPDSTTLGTTQVSRTTIPNGTFSYTVSQIVTPAVVREAKAHFGCDTLTGILLEDLARQGTGGTHFKRRILHNEVMTGVNDESNGVVSRFTLALYEDSGWYKPNYELADPLRFGQNMGCDWVLSGCLSPATKTLRPTFCSNLEELAGYREARSQGKASTFREAGFNSSCAWDRGSYGACLVQNYSRPFDPNFQYFEDPDVAGIDGTADYCPVIHSFTSCKRQRDPALTINAFAEVHGSQSKCVEFRIDKKWVYANSTVPPIIGGACYEVYCMEGEGPVVTVNGANYSCADQREIQIPQVDLPNVANVMIIVCPPCQDLCWENIKVCESSGPTSKVVPTTTGPTSTQPTTQGNLGSIPSIAFFAGGGVILIIAMVIMMVVIILSCRFACKRPKTEARRTNRYGIVPTHGPTTEDDDSDDEEDSEEDDDLLGSYR